MRFCIYGAASNKIEEKYILAGEKLGKAIEDFGKKLEGLLENKELEKSLEDLGKRLEDLFGSFSGEEPAQEEMK